LGVGLSQKRMPEEGASIVGICIPDRGKILFFIRLRASFAWKVR
jgi:hypothetical protein